jgi:hypothetical protein
VRGRWGVPKVGFACGVDVRILESSMETRLIRCVGQPFGGCSEVPAVS